MSIVEADRVDGLTNDLVSLDGELPPLRSPLLEPELQRRHRRL